MRTHNLALQDSLLNAFLEQIRSKEVQKDRMRFRRNMERIGEVMAYEISKSLAYSTKNIATPLGIANVNTVDNDIVLGTIFRAGLPFIIMDNFISSSVIVRAISFGILSNLRNGTYYMCNVITSTF